MTRTPWLFAGAAALLLVTGCSEKESSQQGPSGAGGQQQTQQAPPAQPPQAQAPTAQQGDTPAGAMTISGQVLAAKGGAIKVKSTAGESVFMQLNDQTQVFVNGRQGGIADVTEGSEVRASFQPPSGANLPTALRVDVTGTGTAQ